MVNPRIAARYAKSLLDLAIEQNNLEDTLQDIKMLHESCTLSHDFCVMLRSPVINADKKEAVLEAVFGANMCPLVKGFSKLLVRKKREGALPEIAAEFINQYNKLKNIRIVKLTTAAAVGADVVEAVKTKVAASMPGQTVNMQTAIDPELIGGFLLEMDDKLIDASVRRDLQDIKKTFLDKSYTMQLR